MPDLRSAQAPSELAYISSGAATADSSIGGPAAVAAGTTSTFSSSASSSSRSSSVSPENVTESHPNSEFRFPERKHQRDNSIGSPSSSRFLHHGHTRLESVAPLISKLASDPPSEGLPPPPPSSTTSKPRKMNSRGMRLGAQLKKPGNSSIDTAGSSAFSITGGLDRPSSKSSVSTVGSTIGSSSGTYEDDFITDDGMGESIAPSASYLRGQGKNNSTGPATAPASASASPGRNALWGESMQASKSGSSLQTTPTVPGGASSTGSSTPNSVGAGPTPPRPPRKLGGRVAALAAKLSGNDLSSAVGATSPSLPSPTRANALGSASRLDSSGPEHSSFDSPQPALLSHKSTESSASTTMVNVASSISSSPSASSPGLSQVAANYSPRSSSLRTHTPQSSLGSVRKLGEAIVNFGATIGHSRRSSADVLSGKGVSGNTSGDRSTGGTGGVVGAEGSPAFGRVSEEGREARSRVSSETDGAQNLLSVSIPSASGSGLSLPLSPASPPPRSPRRTMDLTSARLADAAAGSSGSPRASADYRDSSGSATMARVDSATVRASSMASYAASTRSRTTSSGQEGSDGEQMRDRVGSVSTEGGSSGTAGALTGKGSMSSLADVSSAANDGSGDGGVDGAESSQRPFALSVDTSLRGVFSGVFGDASHSIDPMARPGSSDSVSQHATGKNGQSVDSVASVGQTMGPYSVGACSWATAHSVGGSPYGIASASPVLGSASTPMATSASGHSQTHNKTVGRLSRLTYARNDGVSVFGIGGPHGGGKGWSDYSAPPSATPRSPTLHSSSNSFATSFGAASGGGGPAAPSANTSVASSRGGSVSNSVRGSVDANGTPLGLAIANAGVNGAGVMGAAVAGSHGLTLGFSPDVSAGGGSGGMTGGTLSSPAPYKALNAALISARNSLPVNSLRSDSSFGRDKDSGDRSNLASVEEGNSKDEVYGNEASAADRGDREMSNSLTGLGIEHGHSRMTNRSPNPSGRSSLPALSGLAPQRELLLPALQSVRSTFEGNEHRRDTFSLGSGSGHPGQRPLSALIDDSSPLGAAVADAIKDEAQHPVSAVSSGTRSTSSSTWSRTGDGARHGRNSTSPPTTGESVAQPSGRLSLQESAAGDRMRLNRKPSHPTLVEESEQYDTASSSQEGPPRASTVAVGRDSSRPSESKSTAASAASAKDDDKNTGTGSGRSSLTQDAGGSTRTEGTRARDMPGPEDEIDGLTIQMRADGGFTYLDAEGNPLGSKVVLTLAIEKAKKAVTLDSSNKVPEAISAYKHALRLLEEVMDRIAPKPGQRPKANREEERRRLVIIHDTYADRIRLLSAINGNGTRPHAHASKSSLSNPTVKGRRDAASTFNADMIPRPRAVPALEPRRSDGFHEAIAAQVAAQSSGTTRDSAPERERQHSLRSVASAGVLRARIPSIPLGERPASLAQAPDAQQSQAETRQNSISSTIAPRQTSLGSDSRRDSMATALSSHTLTPRNALGSGSSSEKTQHMPKISIQPESPESRQARLADAVITTDGIPRPTKTPKKTLQSEGFYHRRADSDGSGQSQPLSGARRESGSSPSRARGLADGIRTPTTPYFDSSSQLHLEEDSGSKPGSEWGAPQSDGVGEKERTNTLGVGLMSPPQFHGDADSVRLRPLSGYTEAGASQAASDGHPSSDLDRALAGLDASLNQLSHERIHGTVRASTRRQSRYSLHSTAAGGDKAAAAAVAAGAPGAPGATVTARRQKTMSTASRPELPESARGATEFPRMAGGETDADLEPDARAVGSYRQRSSSQPAPKRPPIPSSFMNGTPQPPMPRLTRQGSTSSSHALSPGAAPGRAGSISNIRPGLGGQSGFRFPSPSPSAVSTFGPSDVFSPTAVPYDEEGQPKASAMFDLFPTGLPSVQYSGVASFVTAVSNSAIPIVEMDPGAHDYSQVFPMPANVMMRPFHVLRQLQSSLTTGAHLTRKLYAPKNLWANAQQAGAKIALLDLKVRMLDLVATGMEPVEAGGKALLNPPVTSQPGLLAVQATRFSRQLDEFELLLMDVQNTLAQKMSYVEPVAGKKNKNAFGSIGSRLKGSFGGLTSSSKGMDSPSDYMFSLSRVCSKLGHLDQHVQSVVRAQSGASENEPRSPGTETYAALPTEVRVSIEAKLKRTSDWLANVLLCFVLRDVAVILDRYTKRASIPFVEG
ncbi:unnamed protein product [Tilletia controversa]|uniref:MIT domain-containing protein n=3 Tax=Tilletia TaxID=13289 RepID=A0A8X7N0D8_9BASI|nr:hypothetical protein CF336_g4749 [Tilletia laevis]KAE8203359.1 hypothetical protein CF328_g1699 [Tilletia controversa]KAE8264656.1 hypothetical protein A4X03_0g794 [Tilletia caries]KAE8207209.1 hypothetical protein CF335_g1310 [Tilletia laevis]KAE8254264.1 hypothetical protein A4X06_0g976 [Tilletia controversa]